MIHSAKSTLLRPKNLGAAFLLLLGWGIAAASLSGTSMTADEPNHFDYARRVLEGHFELRFPGDGAKMFVTVLNVLPAKILKPELLQKETFFNDYEAVKMGRHVTLFFSVILGFLIFRWADSLYGTPSAFFALILYTFSPLVLAHRRYVTTDLFAALALFMSLYSLWSYERKPSVWRSVRTAILIALAQLTKYTSLWIFPIAAVLLLSQGVQTKEWGKTFKKTGLQLGFFFLMTVGIVNAAYGFQRSFKPVGQYEFLSKPMLKVQRILPSSLPVPFPEEWVKRFDLITHTEATNQEYSFPYLLGEFRREGFKGYFFWCYLFKEPLAAQILLALAVFFYIKRRRAFNFKRDELFFIIPVLFYALYLNYFTRMHIGLRYALPIFPFLYLFTASLLKNPALLDARFKGTIAALLVYMMVSVLSYYPAFLPYMNEIVWDRTKAYKYLLDSNVQWGIEYWPLLHKKLAKLPPKATFTNPEAPVKGRVIFDLRSYMERQGPKSVSWFLDSYKPTDHAGYAYWIYEIE